MGDFPTSNRNIKKNNLDVVDLVEKIPDKKISFKPSDKFIFSPRPDITTEELAGILTKLILTFHFSIYEKLPLEQQRHFKHVRDGQHN
jgi:hypothetical protein